MRIWLLHIGEELPVDGPVRQFRYGYLADALAALGHDVVRWAPTFRHTVKQHRFSADRRVQVAPHYEIQFVHAPGYDRNVGLARLRAYRVLGRRLRHLMSQEPPPDRIVAAIPSLEWADAAVAYGNQRGIPVVVDVRDLWPDVFLNALPAALRPIGRPLLAPLNRVARRACRDADAIVAVSAGYLDWGLQLAGRGARPSDRVVPLGFEPPVVEPAAVQEQVSQLRRRGIDPRRPVCLFAGLFERSCDLETVIRAARQLATTQRTALQFVLCGDGSKLPMLKRLAAGLTNVHFLGWVDPAMLQAAASISTFGLCAYSPSATQSLPNKPFEYMAGRLAVVSSLPGEMSQLLDRHQCGVSYVAGDATSLAQCLAQLTANQPLVASLRSRAYDAWSLHYRSRDIYAEFAESLVSPTVAAARAA